MVDDGNHFGSRGGLTRRLFCARLPPQDHIHLVVRQQREMAGQRRPEHAVQRRPEQWIWRASASPALSYLHLGPCSGAHGAAVASVWELGVGD
jgi:hypothetical protein